MLSTCLHQAAARFTVTHGTHVRRSAKGNDVKLGFSHLTGLACVLLLASPALAAVDDMPVPRSAPRTKVAQQKLDHDPVRGNRVLTGAVKLLDGDKLRIGDTDIRLYGIVVPQLAGVHGPEARAALVRLMAEDNISCRVLERDRNFRLLAQCRSAKTDDIGLTLLQHGLALVGRSVVHGSDYADPYLAAENKAQVQKLGLWAPVEVKPAEAKPVAAVPPLPVVAALTAAPVIIPEAKNDALRAEAPAPVAAMPASVPVVSAPAKNEAPPNQNSVIPNQLPASDLSRPFPILSQDQMIEWLWFAGMTPAMVMILFALGQIALRRYEYTQERRALAAALRGELLAARAICTTRAEALAYDADMLTGKASALWPRLRANVYGAHIGRIGLLGADLARKVASLYGQFADYAQYYSPRHQAEPVRGDAAGVQQSLFTLIDHIEETLSNLQMVEASGRAYKPTAAARRAAAAPLASRPRAPVMHAEPAEQLEYVAVEAVEDQVRPTRPVIRPQVGAKDKTAEEKIANATSAMMEMLIAEQDDGIAGGDTVVMFDARTTSAREESRTEARSKKTVAKPVVQQGKLPLKAEAEKIAGKAVRIETKTETKTEAKPEAKSEAKSEPRAEFKNAEKATAKVEKIEPKPEYYDFRSQAINIARG